MVLSNKKLKQKLRASVSDAITESVSSSNKPAAASSLKELIDSATHKPRLSKREKRRKNPEKKLENGKKELKNLEKNLENGENEKKEEVREESGVKDKKRKREDEVVKEDVDGVKKKSKKQKKKKKKKGKKKGAKRDEEKAVVIENGETRLADTAIVASSQEDTDSATKVYVGGIPYYSTEDDIRSHFESCGTITDIFCMTFPDTGKFRGIAIINFKTEAAAKRALGFDETDMGGLLLKVKPYKVPGATKTTERTPNFAPQMLKGYNRVYVGNLSWDVTEEDLRNLFADCSISSIRFGTDKETGVFRGFAHVDFSDCLSLTMALKLDQELVCGRPAKISYAVPPKTAPKPVTVTTEPEPEPEPEHEPTIIQEDTNTMDPAAAKKKIRRKCYLCGEKGHLSSSCPTAQNQDQKNA